MRFLTRDELLNPTELKTVDEPTPELGEGTGVRLRELGAGPRIRLQSFFGDNVEGGDAIRYYCKLLVESIIDSEGNRVCNDDGDLDTLIEHDIALIVRLGKVASELSGLGGVSEDVGDEVKN